MEAAGRGFYIGFTGVLTYPGNGELRELVPLLPRDRILAETDSPYLAPQAVRGRLNQPANVRFVAEALAGLLGMDYDEACGLLLKNSLAAFLLSPRRTDLVYRLHGRIYMNITGRCDNDCVFCIRKFRDGIGGYHLQHGEEPSETALESIIGSLDPSWSSEVVFCGYGEPTMRPRLLRSLAETASSRGFSVRLNTNGLCLQRLTGQQVSRMLEPFDAVSVSLNGSSEIEYENTCRPGLKDAWSSLMEFIRMAEDRCRVYLTAVRWEDMTMDGEMALRSLAEELGLPFRMRG